MQMNPTMRRRYVVPLVLLVLLVAVIVIARQATGTVGYHAELPHAAGLRAGDKVRIAGLSVGTVDDIRAKGDTVHVDFAIDRDARLTVDTVMSVKLASLLGDRFLALEPGKGDRLDHDATISKQMARGSFTIEQFWLEATPNLEALDLQTVETAIDVLSTDLATAPEDVRAALDGMTGLATIVNERDQQLGRILAASKQLTATVLDQQDELDALMTNADLVMTMAHQRRDTLAALLRSSNKLATGITELARATRKDLDPMLANLKTVVTTLTTQKKDLDKILELAGPTMRFYTNASGDGPWLGVNAPYFIVPDGFFCTATPLECS